MATVKKIGTELEWEVDKNVARGTVNGFRVSLLQNTDLAARQTSYKTMVVGFDEIVKEQAEALVDFINENKKVLRALNFKVSATFVNIYINEGFKGLNATNLTEALTTLTTGFSQIGIAPSSKCIYCNQETIDEVIVKRIAIRAHQSCHDSNQEIIKEQEDNVKYTAGIIGALIGGFVGGLLFFIVFFIGWILPLLMIPVGFLVFLGYKLLGGKFTHKAKFIILGVSIASVLFTLLFSLFIEASYLGVPMIDLLLDSEFAYGETFLFSLLWGLAGSSSGYGLAKKREF